MDTPDPVHAGGGVEIARGESHRDPRRESDGPGQGGEARGELLAVPLLHVEDELLHAVDAVTLFDLVVVGERPEVGLEGDGLLVGGRRPVGDAPRFLDERVAEIVRQLQVPGETVGIGRWRGGDGGPLSARNGRLDGVPHAVAGALAIPDDEGRRIGVVLQRATELAHDSARLEGRRRPQRREPGDVELLFHDGDGDVVGSGARQGSVGVVVVGPEAPRVAVEDVETGEAPVVGLIRPNREDQHVLKVDEA